LKHRREIDGLRALAILPVLFYHAGFKWVPGGFFGVDVFFVISGFLITGIILSELHTLGRFSIIGFYERRARRIMPALFLVMGFMYPVAWFLLFPDQWATFNESLRWIVFFASNYFFLGKMGYFDPNIDLNPMLHTWSLAIEEQFYLFFPLILWMLWKLFKERFWIPILALVGVGSLLWAQNHYSIDPTGNFYLLQFRAWELIAGSIVAIFLSHRGRTSYSSQWLSLLGLAMLAYSIAKVGNDQPHPGLITLIPVVGSVLLIMFAGPGTLVNRLLSMKFFVGIGLISYSAYLWHQPIFAFFRVSQLHDPHPREFLPLIALTLLLSWGSWKFVENPFRQRKKFSRRFIFSATAIGMIIVLAGTWVVARPALQSNRQSLSGVSFAELQARLNPNRGLSFVCSSFHENEPKCVNGSHPNVLLWGDSYAMYLALGLKSGSHPLQFVQQTKSACNPVLGVSIQNTSSGIAFAKACMKENNDVLDWLKRHKNIKYAILGSPWSTVLASTAKIYGHNGVVGPAGDYGWSRFAKTLHAIEDLGVKPIVVTASPTNGEDHGSCVLRAIANKTSTGACNFPKAKDSRHAINLKVASAAAAAGATVFWMDDLICPHGTCYAERDGVIIYRDAGHLSREGSIYLGTKYDFGKLMIDAANHG
jgi:peptidoglycan/LPS O-acetylase OafA/YrhL